MIRIADKRRFEPFAADGVSVWQQDWVKHCFMFRVCEIAVGAAKTIDFCCFFKIIHIIHKKLDITGV